MEEETRNGAMSEGPGNDVMRSEPKECKRPKIEYLKEYEIRVRFLSRGCVISVGCREIPFTSVEEGMLAFNAYVADPQGERTKWNKLFND